MGKPLEESPRLLARPVVCLSCPTCGTGLRPKRGWLFVANFSSMLTAMLLMQAAKDSGVGLGMRLVGFVAILFLLRILLTALLLRFTPREEEGGSLGISERRQE